MPSTVPGDAAALRTFAGELRRTGDELLATGERLRGVDTDAGGWTGEAADAFRDSYSRFTPRWLTAGDAFHDASAAVDRYTDVLEWAQRRTAQAEQEQAEAAAASRKAKGPEQGA